MKYEKNISFDIGSESGSECDIVYKNKYNCKQNFEYASF